MKKQILLLLAVLLTGVSAFALASLNSTLITVTFQVDPEGAGDVLLSGQKTTSSYAFSNMNMTVSATANPGYGFEGWYIDGEKKGSDVSSFTFLTAETNMTVVAKFTALAASTLTLKVKEGKGSVGFITAGTVVSDDSRKYTSGSEVTVSATPEKGNEFVHWEDGDGNVLATTRNYTFTIQSDITLQAVFKAKENYNPELISFPGAEGYGRFTTGGRAIDERGAKVYYVTRLDDCSDANLVEGTFRWAVKSGDDTPRTVLFKVAGTIYLTSKLSGLKPNLTIAGQTAPGGGICLAGYQMKLPSNSIVRHIRFRAGDLPSNSNANNGNSMSMLDVENVQNVILDHCTFAWSMEENITMYDCNYTTVQWCIFSESLYNSGNTKGARAYGAQWGGEHGTMHHCLFAHNVSRSPRFNGVRSSVNDRQVDSEFINNVIFNWGNHNSVYGGECSAGGATDYNRTYMINNYYKPGPATRAGTSSGRHFVRPTGGSINEVGEWYLSGNKFETGSKWAGTSNIWSDEVLEKVNADNYWGFLTEKGRGIHFWSLSPSQELYDTKLLKSLPEGYKLTMSYETADEAYDKVVKQAGASLPRYDEVDARVLKEAAGEIDPQFKGDYGQLGIIDTPYDITLQSHDEFAALREEDNKEIDVTCYPRLQPVPEDFATQVVDTDGDGLPDAYETEVGLNPNDATDGMKLSTSGYSNLEVFLNGVADRTIDVKKYTQHQSSEPGMTTVNATVGAGETYTTIQAAIDAAPGDATPYYIFVKDGEYVGHVQINRANTHLIGQSREKTIISWNKLHNEDGGNVDKNATVNVTANDVSFDNLTIRNTRINEGQALALYTKADRITITNCNLEGYQDTYRTGKDGQRHLIRNSKIAGRTDFIYGGGEVFFDACELNIVETGGYIIAPTHITSKYGYVFSNCTIAPKSSGMTTYLGRPWGGANDHPQASFINTKLASGVSIYPAGWIDMASLPKRFAEYNTTDASGNELDLSQRKTSFKNENNVTGTNVPVLSKVETNSYKLDYMLRGTDSWDADWQAFILPAPKVTKNEGKLYWNDETGYAKSFLVIKDGVATITTDTSCDYAENITVQSITSYGVTGEIAKASEATGIQGVINSQQTITKREYFTLDGRQMSRIQHGVNIIRETLSDGTSRTVKVVAK